MADVERLSIYEHSRIIEMYERGFLQQFIPDEMGKQSFLQYNIYGHNF